MLLDFEFHVSPHLPYGPDKLFLAAIFVEHHLDIQNFILRTLATIAQRYNKRISADRIEWVPLPQSMRHLSPGL
jgi:hypothetical protein